MITFTRAFTRTMTLATFALVVSACGSDGPMAPFQPQVTNATDSFQGQATGVSGASGTVSYTWANTGTRATINHSTTTSAGTTMLTIRDASNTVVYSRALSPSLNEPTVVGVSGNWTIQLTVNNYSGTMNFRVQKL